MRIIDNLNKLSDDLDNIYEQLTNKDENQRLQKLMQVILKIKTIMKSRITGDIREERNRVYPLCCGLVILRNDHDISQNNKEFMIHSEKAIFAMGYSIELYEKVDDEYYQKFKDSYKQYFGELIL